MIGLIVAMVGGVFVAVVALIIGVDGGAAVWIGVAGALVVFVLVVAVTMGRVPRAQEQLPVLFPLDPPEVA